MKKMIKKMQVMGLFFALLALVGSCKTEEPKPKPVAKFSMSTTSGVVPFNVNFTNESQNATKYEWSINGGAINTSFNISFEVRTAGTYVVQLKAIGDGSEDITKQTITATQPAPMKPVPRFTVFPERGFAPLLVNTDNKSLNATEYEWNFQDGGVQNKKTGLNSDYRYTTPGPKTVYLTAKGPGGQEAVAGYVYVSADPTVAASTGTFKIGEPVGFTSGTDVLFKYEWNLGEPGATSTAAEPKYTYQSEGTKKITLKVTDPTGNFKTATKDYNVVKVKDGTIVMSSTTSAVRQAWRIYTPGGASFLSSSFWLVSDNYNLSGHDMPFDANFTNATPYLYGSKTFTGAYIGTNTYQAFKLIPSNENNYYQIYCIRHGAGWVLDGGGINGTKPYWSNQPNKSNNAQKFRFTQQSNGTYWIQVKDSGRYLEWNY